MSIEREVASSETRAHRRWLIGIGITLVFGTFGAVMAFLAYTKLEQAAPAQRPSAVNRSKAPAPSGAAPVTPAPAEAPVTTPSDPPAEDHPKRDKHRHE